MICVIEPIEAVKAALSKVQDGCRSKQNVIPSVRTVYVGE